MLRVDQVNGNDSTGSINGLPFSSVWGAIQYGLPGGTAYSGNTAYTIWVMPGYYGNSAIYVPEKCAVRGLSTQTVCIGLTGAVDSTNLVTMGPTSRIEDVTLEITTSQPDVNITGIYFPGSSTSSKALTCVVNASSSASSGAGYVYGILSTGQTILNGVANAYTLQSTNMLQRCTINTNSFGNNTGNVRAMYIPNGSTCQVAVRDCVFYAGFTGNTGRAIGVENGSTASFISLKTSTVFGGTADIKQDLVDGSSGNSTFAPSIQLSATDLLNEKTDDHGFSVNSSPSQIIFVGTGTITGAINTYYFLPGNATLAASNTAQGVIFAQKTIIFAMSVYLTGLPTSTNNVTINLYKSNSYSSISNPSPFASCTFVSNSPNTIILQNFSTLFLPGLDFLIVELIKNVNNSGATTPVIISLSSY